MATPTEALISTAGGDFFLTLFAVLFMFIIGLCGWLVYRMPLEWEKSTDRIVSKLCEIMQGQRELSDSLRAHDEQAKKIMHSTEKIEDNLDRRPCANGKH